jgi:hypothetical protein
VSEAIVVTQGERADMSGSEVFIAIHCQECGERITDAGWRMPPFHVVCNQETSNRSRSSALIVMVFATKKTLTAWIKLHEFIEALADSVGMKTERKSKKQ